MPVLSYREVHNVVAHLPIVLRNVRARRDLSLRDAADEIGISYTSLWRFERGNQSLDVGSVLLLITWLDGELSARASAAITAGIDTEPGRLRAAPASSGLTPVGPLTDGRLAANVEPVDARDPRFGLDGGW